MTANVISYFTFSVLFTAKPASERTSCRGLPQACQASRVQGLYGRARHHDAWGPAANLPSADDYRPSWPCFVVVARSEVLEEHGDAVDRLLKAVGDQARGLMAKRTAPEVIAQRYGLTLDDAREWFGVVRWNVDGGVEETALRDVCAVLREAGMIDILPAGVTLTSTLTRPL